ncbi:MAG: hypothetical protein AAFR74_07730 [Pseudomonadota bacterium]
MKWAICGLSVAALAQTGLVYASPQAADVWIGFQDSDNGFLLDEDTGDLWMTGPCLKGLERAVLVGETWISHTVEMVSVGRVNAQLDQRITLNVSGLASITVESAGRGGPQTFPAVTDRQCGAGQSGQCARLIASQLACQG